MLLLQAIVENRTPEYLQGFEAASMGASKNCVPYNAQFDTPQYRDWQNGYDDFNRYKNFLLKQPK